MSTAHSSPILPPLVVCGPSGVGKGTLITRLRSLFNGAFGYSISHTTRKPRQGELDSVNYHFTTVHKMEEMISKGLFIENANVHGNLYGTSFESVRDVQAQNRICILEIDVQGAQQVHDSGMSAHYLFITPPSVADLKERLLGRQSESEESLNLRLRNAEHELQVGDTALFFEKKLVNDDLEEATRQLIDIVSEWYPHLHRDVSKAEELATSATV